MGHSTIALDSDLIFNITMTVYFIAAERETK